MLQDKLYDLQNKNNENADNNASTTKEGFSIVSTSDYAKENTSSKEEYLKSKASYAEQRKKENALKKVEKNIEETETRISEIDEEMNKPENATNVALLMELQKEKDELDVKLNELYEKWEEVQS